MSVLLRMNAHMNPTQQMPPDLVEALARRVHEAWMRSRAEQGWQYGSQRNDKRRLHPCLVPYDDLLENEKEIDRATVRAVLEAIEQDGYNLIRRSGP